MVDAITYLAAQNATLMPRLMSLADKVHLRFSFATAGYGRPTRLPNGGVDLIELSRTKPRGYLAAARISFSVLGILHIMMAILPGM